MTTNTGGPAFPRDHAHDGHNGMTLRDYFAAKIMQGELAAQNETSGFYENVGALAFLAYRMADAMLKAREVQA